MLKIESKITYKCISLLMAFGILISCCGISVSAKQTESARNKTTVIRSDDVSYEAYQNINSHIPDAFDTVTITNAASKFTETKNTKNWTFTATKSGAYNLSLDYAAIVDNGKEMNVSVLIDGKSPFAEASYIRLEQKWSDVLSPDGSFFTNHSGDEMLPESVQSDERIRLVLKDAEGYYSSPLKFYLTAGTHRLTLVSNGSDFRLYGVSFTAPQKLISYKEYQKQHSTEYRVPKDFSLKIQAERPSCKSDATIYAASDKSDPKIEPSDSFHIKRNVIGTNNWKNPGQYLEWEFEVPVTGYYRFCFKYAQTSNRGLYNLRKLSIDGSVPFSEAANLHFEYTDGYDVTVPGDGTSDYLFYLTAGSHTLRLEVTVGELSDTLIAVEQCRLRLSELRRKIIMITSVSPDLYRDYYLEEGIPELVSELKDIAKILIEQADGLEKTTDRSGTNAVSLTETADQLKKFADRTYLIPEQLSELTDKVSTLATWINGMREQLLVLDYIMISAPDVELPHAKSNFFQKAAYELKMLVYSYARDYTSFEKKDNSEPVEVWISGGRDQRDILKELVESSGLTFPVQIKLVETSITNAIMAGIGPDVVLNIAPTEPVNLGMRGALEPLDGYEGFSELKQQFAENAFVPYELEEKTYGVPITESFEMLFVRNDIFASLGIEVPQTWDDFFALTRILQQNHMEAGLPDNLFAVLLYQRGGRYYDKDLTKLAFNTPVAFNTFREWVEYYTQYSFSLFKNDYNRFRTGEMPMMISAYTMYNQLSLAAPEIRNDWSMYKIPGTLRKDGTLNHTAIGTAGTVSVMLSDSSNKENAWKFLRWWADGETQAKYGNRIEYILGVGGRYNPANQMAFRQIPWSEKESQTILSQWDSVAKIPEVPGSYYVSRNLTNAFNACATRNEDVKETFAYWNEETNKEIARKRAQYLTK